MQLRRRSNVGILVVVMAARAAAAAAAGPEQGALYRVRATVEAAAAYWSDARAAVAEAEAAAARARAEGAAGSPFVAWTSEGLDGSLSRTDNAQDVLHLGIPFNWPGQGAAARGYADAATAAAGFERSIVAVRAALDAGRVWVERAGWLDRLSVHRDRLERIDRALALQEARYQLGEVSGSEVMQLDLEHVRQSSQVALAEAESIARLERLRELCGPGFVDPLPGDLRALADATATPAVDELTEESVEAGSLLQRARAAAEMERARTELSAAAAFGRPSAGVEWERVPSLGGAPSYDAWGFALSVPLPLGRAGRELREAARAEALVSDARIEGIRRALVRRARVAGSDAEAAQRRLAALNTALGELASIEHSIEQQFRLGVMSYLVYLDGLDRLDDVRLETVAALEQLLLARLEVAAILADRDAFPLPVTDDEEQDR